MSEDLIRHYVFYIKADGKDDFQWPVEEYGIVTKSAVRSVIGSQVWVVCGKGAPTEFSIHYTFRAEKVEPWPDGGHRISGRDGFPFKGGWVINPEPWFAELKRTQFWSLGLYEVKSDEVLDALDEMHWEIFGGEPMKLESFTAIFDEELAESRSQTSAVRMKRLEEAPRLPERMQVISTAFLRNPDVIAEVLHRANGICGKCGNPAPFTRKSDGSPYLEVHHWIPLSEGGEDTVGNAVALCPNCHREAHFG